MKTFWTKPTVIEAEPTADGDWMIHGSIGSPYFCGAKTFAAMFEPAADDAISYTTEKMVRDDERKKIITWLRYGEIDGGTRLDAEGFAEEIVAMKHTQPIFCSFCGVAMQDGDEANDNGAQHLKCARDFYTPGSVGDGFTWGTK